MSPAPLLVLTADADLADDLLRLSAAAGVRAEPAGDPAQVGPRWQGAALVLLGPDAAARCAELGLPRREGVFMVCRGRPPVESWPWAVACGVERVFALPVGEAEIVGLLGDLGERADHPGRVICVTGGSGGAGASVLSSGLAAAAARDGRRVLLVDADPYGGGVDLVFGAEEVPGLRWRDLLATSGRVSAAALCAALPRSHGVAMLTCGRDGPFELPPAAVQSVLNAARRAGQTAVVDLPRHTTAGSAVAQGAADVLLLVTVARLRPVAAAARVAAVLRDRVRDLRLVVRQPRRGGLPTTEVARSLGLPVAGELRADPTVSPDLERGEPPGARGRGTLAVLCRDLVEQFDPVPAGAVA